MDVNLDAHAGYLRRVSQPEGPVRTEVADKALATWKACVAVVPEHFFPPGATTTEDGRIIYCWDAEGIHLEAEMIHDQHTEWFYQNDHTKELWLEETDELTAQASNAIREVFDKRA